MKKIAKKLLLHIGYPKAASTFIQHLAYELSTSQDSSIPNILYPISRYSSSLSGGNLFAFLSNYIECEEYNLLGDFILSILDGLNDTSCGVDIVVLSGEIGVYQPKEKLIGFIATIESLFDEIEVLIIEREKEGLITSLYNQSVKATENYSSFDSFVEDFDRSSFFINVDEIITALESIQKVVISRIPYSKQFLNSQIASFLGVKNDVVEAFQRDGFKKNESIDSVELEFIRLVNYLGYNSMYNSGAMKGQELEITEDLIEIISSISMLSSHEKFYATLATVIYRIGRAGHHNEDQILHRFGGYSLPLLTKYIRSVVASDGLIINPLEYLFLNKDVATAGIDPIEHYENYGRFENRRISL